MTTSKSGLHRVGPYSVDVSALPDAWREYAASQFHVVNDENASLVKPLAFTLRDVRDGAHEPTMVDVQSQQITREGSVYVVENPGAFRAYFDPRVHTLTIDVDAHMQHPNIVFGNALRGAVSVALPLLFDGLMFHASSAILDENGAFFPGISTAGKTTLALGFERARYLSDDVSLIDQLSTTPRQTPSPFFGAFGKMGDDVHAPLVVVGVLVAKSQTKTNFTKVHASDATALLLRHVVNWTQDRDVQAAMLSRIVDLVARVPVVAVERHIDDTSDAVFESLLRFVSSDG